jgi:hypothetical protein
MTIYYNENDVETLRDVLIGRSITSVQLGGNLPEIDKYSSSEGKITLDDGTELVLGGNDGGCSCGAGDYELTRLNDMPINGIMNVEVEVEKTDEYSGNIYRIFVLAQDERFELAEFEGDDGNGYYGTGFWFSIIK